MPAFDPHRSTPERTSRACRRPVVSSRDMRFRAYVVFCRLCGAAGLGVFVGATAAGLINVITGAAFAHEPTWLTGAPVLVVFGALGGFVVSWLTRRWFTPTAPYRRLSFTAAGALMLPLATAVSTGSTVVTFPLMLAGAAWSVTLWVRGFRSETRQARAMMYGYGRFTTPSR